MSFGEMNSMPARGRGLLAEKVRNGGQQVQSRGQYQTTSAQSTYELNESASHFACSAHTDLLYGLPALGPQEMV